MGRRIRNKLRSHARERNRLKLLTDAAKLPSLIAEVLAKLLPGR